MDYELLNSMIPCEIKWYIYLIFEHNYLENIKQVVLKELNEKTSLVRYWMENSMEVNLYFEYTRLHSCPEKFFYWKYNKNLNKWEILEYIPELLSGNRFVVRHDTPKLVVVSTIVSRFQCYNYSFWTIIFH
jgi:hypothetical protein